MVNPIQIALQFFVNVLHAFPSSLSSLEYVERRFHIPLAASVREARRFVHEP